MGGHHYRKNGVSLGYFDPKDIIFAFVITTCSVLIIWSVSAASQYTKLSETANQARLILREYRSREEISKHRAEWPDPDIITYSWTPKRQNLNAIALWIAKIREKRL